MALTTQNEHSASEPTFPDSLCQKIQRRHDLWRDVCVLSLELLEGTNEHIDKVLALYRRDGVTRQEWQAANAACAANAAAAYAAYAANAATYAAANATANATANAACAANANAAANAAYAAAEPHKVERFIAELFLLVECAPQHDERNSQQAIL